MRRYSDGPGWRERKARIVEALTREVFVGRKGNPSVLVMAFSVPLTRRRFKGSRIRAARRTGGWGDTQGLAARTPWGAPLVGILILPEGSLGGGGEWPDRPRTPNGTFAKTKRRLANRFEPFRLNLAARSPFARTQPPPTPPR